MRTPFLRRFPGEPSWETLYERIVTKPGEGYASGTRKGPGVWEISGVVGDTWNGSIRYGIRECSQGWEWEVGIDLNYKPDVNWRPLSPQKHWPLNRGVVDKSFKKDEVSEYVAQEAGNWLTVLRLWSRLRFSSSGEFDMDKRMHDCEWCMGHHNWDGKHQSEPFDMTAAVSVGTDDD